MVTGLSTRHKVVVPLPPQVSVGRPGVAFQTMRAEFAPPARRLLLLPTAIQRLIRLQGRFGVPSPVVLSRHANTDLPPTGDAAADAYMRITGERVKPKPPDPKAYRFNPISSTDFAKSSGLSNACWSGNRRQWSGGRRRP
jgi:hypothetical protein